MRFTAILGLALTLVVPMVAHAQEEFPGPKIRDQAPYNKSVVLSGGSITCKKGYDSSQLVTDKRTIVDDVTQCVRDGFGNLEGLSLQFGETATPYARCVISSTYITRPPGNNPLWVVCCPLQIQDDGYRMSCRLYYTGR